jgi:pyruvate, orthophosphate dikinase
MSDCCDSCSCGQKRIYFFSKGASDGRSEMKELLGGKGANLAEMSNIGLPVPPGFTLTTQTCADFYEAGKQWPSGLEEEMDANIAKLEEVTGRKLGDENDPLLVSVRSGAAVSMPGMMDTVLNLGMNDKAVLGLAKKGGDERFAWDCYRRFIQMFGNVAMNISHDLFDGVMHRERDKAGVANDSELSADCIKEIVAEFKVVYKDNIGSDLPQCPKEQLKLAIDAVFGSWHNPQAVRYREINEIKGLLGTAVNVQTMVYGNMGDTSFTGVGFTRNPATGENKLYGEYLINAQGEDVVAGIRTPKNVDVLSSEDLSDFPDATISADEAKALYSSMYDRLVEIKATLEGHYTDMQDFEFTGQAGELFMLQTRGGKRTAEAAVQIAVDMKNEGLIDETTAVLRVHPNQIEQLLHEQFDVKAKAQAEADGKMIATGLPASPGAAVGKIALTADRAEEMAADGSAIILVREETCPEDIGGMHAAVGILTARGGMTSHAAVVARGMGKCCVAGCSEVHWTAHAVTVAGQKFEEGDVISLDGTAGQVFNCAIDLVKADMSGAFGTLMEWAEDYRNMGVWANADTPGDAQVALDFGAEGIGLCRTEHMFFEEERIAYVRQMMLTAPDVRRLTKIVDTATFAVGQSAGEEKARLEAELAKLQAELAEKSVIFDGALEKLLPEQRKDFDGIFRVMNGKPVVIRLLDPPLHEFLPHEAENRAALAEQMGVTVEFVNHRCNELRELNPMLGHRGCRLGLTYPAVYRMQVQAIIEAALACKADGIDVRPEIMIPLIGTANELRIAREDAEEVCKKVLADAGAELDYKIGTMIEIPRAALTADEVAEYADFFSFGTNDLTQMTFGYSRDDVGVFVPEYVEREILENDPFQVLDQSGVGILVKMAIEKARTTKPKLKIGICGEHGGEPRSVEFCHSVGMNYVSCSPYRVPVARLAAAQAAIKAQA